VYGAGFYYAVPKRKLHIHTTTFFGKMGINYPRRAILSANGAHHIPIYYIPREVISVYQKTPLVYREFIPDTYSPFREQVPETPCVSTSLSSPSDIEYDFGAVTLKPERKLLQMSQSFANLLLMHW
jgi:hypothetical protein